jgi:hypothetical protein
VATEDKIAPRFRVTKGEAGVLAQTLYQNIPLPLKVEGLKKK